MVFPRLRVGVFSSSLAFGLILDNSPLPCINVSILKQVQFALLAREARLGTLYLYCNYIQSSRAGQHVFRGQLLFKFGLSFHASSGYIILNLDSSRSI